MNGKQLKNSILQWAIQGKLVPQDPNDEPASVLLERIRDEKARLVKEKKIKKDKNESIIFRGDDNSHYEKFADGTIKCIDDEIPFEIPQSWCWVRFGSLVIHNPQVTADDEANAAFMPMTLIDAGYGSSYTYETKKWGTIKTGFTKIATGDIAYAKITPCFQNRKSFILGEVPGGVAAATTELNVIRTYAGTLDGWYILYFLKSEYFIKEARYKGTAGQQRVLSDYVQNKLVPLPPLNEQKRIVQKIQEALPIVRIYGKSQEALDKLNADIFDKLKKSVLQEAIQGRLVPQDPNDESASVLLERIKAEKAKLFTEGKLKKKDLVDSVIFKGDDNKYYETIDGKTECIDEQIPFELPHNWCWATLGNLVQNCSGLAYKKENLDERSTSYIRVLRGGNIDDGQWTMKDDDVMIASKFVKPELLLTAGTFITPAVTSIEQMGKTALVRDDQPQTVVGGFVLMLLPFLRDWSLLDYLELIFQSEYYKGYCRSITNKSGQAFYNLSRQKLMQFLVPLPPLNERIAIANEVAKINSMMR